MKGRKCDSKRDRRRRKHVEESGESNEDRKSKQARNGEIKSQRGKE
jgi:hypothetical protein